MEFFVIQISTLVTDENYGLIKESKKKALVLICTQQLKTVNYTHNISSQSSDTKMNINTFILNTKTNIQLRQTFEYYTSFKNRNKSTLVANLSSFLRVNTLVCD